MSAIGYIKGLLGLNDEQQADGLESLKRFLEERQNTLSLTAEYGRPSVNTQGEITAVFPMTLYYDGERYGGHGKEFPLPDSGLSDEDAALTKFLNAHGIESVENLAAIEGETANAVLKDNGEVEVEVGN